MATSLKDKAIKLLGESKGYWPLICRETGLDYNWLAKLAGGKIADPGVMKIERLLAFFEEKDAA